MNSLTVKKSEGWLLDAEPYSDVANSLLKYQGERT